MSGATPPAGDSDLVLVERAVAGDQRAFELLVLKYERRIQRLEYRIHREANDGNRYGRYGYNQYGQAWDRDRDGLNDRYERDRGTNYDEDRDPD